jgi:hypothetical protein
MRCGLRLNGDEPRGDENGGDDDECDRCATDHDGFPRI